MTAIADTQPLVRDSQGSWTLDPSGSSAEFHVKHFWGAMTVHGRFERLAGEGRVASDGNISGRLAVDATSLTTNNRKTRRASPFCGLLRHRTPSQRHRVGTRPRCDRTDCRAWHGGSGSRGPLEAIMAVLEARPEALTLRCEVVVDRTGYAMTWSPLGMASRWARAVVTALFVRQ